MHRFLDYFTEKYFTPKKEKALSITQSQLWLLKLLANGYTLKEIAKLSQKTYYNIQKRTAILYRKFEVKSRGELINKALKNKFISNRDIKKRFKTRFKPKTNQIKESNFQLTPREWQLLQLKKLGKTRVEIMQMMNLWSFYQYNQLRTRICNKMQCKNLTEAICIAYKFEII